MRRIDVYLEIGGKKTFACAVDWPGWSRAGRTEDDALEALASYGPRYAAVLGRVALPFEPPDDAGGLTVVERVAGGAGTDFGVPGVAPAADSRPLDAADLERQRDILRAAWAAFDDAARDAVGVELRKGPRGGGRDLDRIVDHVREAEDAYVMQLGARPAARTGTLPADWLDRSRGDVLDALTARALGRPVANPRPTRKPWAPRYFVRRATWHLLDHAWEIQDRAAAG